MAFNAAWEPNNNPFSSILTAISEQDRRSGNAQRASELEALAGAGFLSVKKCKKDANGVVIQSSCVVTTPGKLLGDTLSKAVGGDIDFIMSAEQISDYASAIANAAINRLIAEGTEGLLGVDTPNSPSGGFTSPGVTGACAGLTGQAFQACQNAVTQSGNSFAAGRDTAINQIDLTLLPRQEAQPIIQSTIQALQQYQTSLNSLYSYFNSLTGGTCPAIPPQYPTTVIVSEVKQQILNELAQATSTLSQLESDFAENQNVIDPIALAKNQIENLDEGDWVGLTTISQAIAPSLDAFEALAFKSAAEAQRDSVISNINSKLSTFNQQKAQCQSQP